MTQDAILSLALLIAIIGLTPGPLSLMVFAHGAQIGMRRALPFIIGGALGYTAIVLFCCVSLSGMLQALPALTAPAKALSALILIWFSWRIATSGMVAQTRSVSDRAMFVEACALQALNPKAWAAGLALATRAMGGLAPVKGAAMSGAVVFAVILAALLVWAFGGQSLRRFLHCDFRRRTFNLGMAGALLSVGLPGLVT